MSWIISLTMVQQTRELRTVIVSEALFSVRKRIDTEAWTLKGSVFSSSAIQYRRMKELSRQISQKAVHITLISKEFPFRTSGCIARLLLVDLWVCDAWHLSITVAQFQNTALGEQVHKQIYPQGHRHQCRHNLAYNRKDLFFVVTNFYNSATVFVWVMTAIGRSIRPCDFQRLGDLFKRRQKKKPKSP